MATVSTAFRITHRFRTVALWCAIAAAVLPRPRLEGTNVELGKEIIKKSGLQVIPADNLADAAEKIVREVNKAA